MRILGIVGTGLIGGSIGLRAKRDGARVLGFDVNAGAVAAALAVGAIDECVAREDLYARCDSVVIATPLDAACAELRSLAGADATWRLVVDVASVKVPIETAAIGVRNFVATHPMAGSESSGPGAARADLFEGRTWAYIPSGDADLDRAASELVRSCGAEPLAVEAEMHDAAVAVTSHLPQMLAWLLAGRVREGGNLYERLCGPAGREVMRLSRSSPELWAPILHANAERIGVEGRALARAIIDACDGLQSSKKVSQ